MALVGASQHDNALRYVQTLGSSSFDGFVPVTRLLGSSLPSGTGPYMFVVFGHIGGTGYLGDTDVNAEILLGSSNGTFLGNRHIIRSDDPVTRGTTGQAHSFCIMYRATSWDVAYDFVVYARSYRFNANATAAVLTVDSCTILAFDLTALAAADWTHTSTIYGPPHQMAYTGEADDHLLLSSTIAAGDWLTFFTARVCPGTDQAPYNIWLEQLPAGAWGAPTTTWGLGHLGVATRAYANDPSRANYWLGHCGVMTVTGATTKLGLASRNLYAAPFPRSSVTDCAIFAVRMSALGGAFSFRQDPTGDFWGTIHAPASNSKEIVIPGSATYNVLSAAEGLAYNDRGKSFQHYLRLNETRLITNPTPLAPYVHSGDEGATEWRFGTYDVDTVVDVQEFGWRNPLEVDRSELRFAVPSVRPVFRYDEVFGQTSGARCICTEDTPVGSTRMYYVQRQGNYLPGENLAVRRAIDPVAVCGNPPYVEVADKFIARYWQLAGWSWQSSFTLTPIPAEVAGADLVVVPGYEALGLASLTVLPIEPSLPLVVEYVRDVTEVRTISGYVIQWPRFTTTRRVVTLSWLGLSVSDTAALVAFRAALGAQAFKWTFPNDTAQGAWVFTAPTLEIRDEGATVSSVQAEIAEIVYKGP